MAPAITIAASGAEAASSLLRRAADALRRLDTSEELLLRGDPESVVALSVELCSGGLAILRSLRTGWGRRGEGAEVRAVVGRHPAFDAHRAARSAPLPLRRPRGADGEWLVIVGGETRSAMLPDRKGVRPGKYLGGHPSIEVVGNAYSRLKPIYGRDHIIVIMQLRETLEWLAEASRSEEDCARLTGRASSMDALRGKLERVREACGELIADGGADYDGEDVNSHTVLSVLKGTAHGRCLPRSPAAVQLLLISHGYAHPSPLAELCSPQQQHETPLQSPCDTPDADAAAAPGGGAQEGSATDAAGEAGGRVAECAWRAEWYCDLPYACPDHAASLYDGIAFDRDPLPEWQWGAPKHRFRLYARMLAVAALDLCSRGCNPVVCVLQFCHAGGFVQWIDRKAPRQHFRTRESPVFMVASAGAFEPSLGDVMPLWVDEFVAAVSSGGTLADVYVSTERRYWEANKGLAEFNRSLPPAPVAARVAEQRGYGVTIPHAASLGTPSCVAGGGTARVPAAAVAPRS
eukprot:TRINITY_DN17574_c0_g1_i1.p1 TRINITY_DN17574_c0_g1~~TRINITY_DN17574_c0_g1_i1.p1  ORF type:complete len:541 (+),score=104.58 TRINITY_DN17574_c0_g1_i1:67-1623(+)